MSYTKPRETGIKSWLEFEALEKASNKAFYEMHPSFFYLEGYRSAYDVLAQELESLKASMWSWEVATEMRILANSDKQWNELIKERDALAKELAVTINAKQENDERFMIERDELRAEVERLNKYVIAGYEEMHTELRAAAEKLAEALAVSCYCNESWYRSTEPCAPCVALAEYREKFKNKGE